MPKFLTSCNDSGVDEHDTLEEAIAYAEKYFNASGYQSEYIAQIIPHKIKIVVDYPSEIG